MLISHNLSEAQEYIIQTICGLTIDAIKSLKETQQIEHELSAIGIEPNVEKLHFEMHKSLKAFQSVINTPGKVTMLKGIELSLFKHGLFNYREEFPKDFNPATKNIWYKIIVRDDFEKFILLN